MPTDNVTVTLCVAYTLAASGETRTATQTFELPLALVAPCVPPLKTAAFKMTLDTNRAGAPPSLMDLFADCLTQPPSILPSDQLSRIAGTGAFVLSFGYRNGADATILVSKNGGRYRIQAGSLEALTLIAAQLARRLQGYYASLPGGGAGPGESPAFTVGYSEPLPLADYLGLMEGHLNTRRRLLGLYSDLNDRCHEYRLVAKRLLVRWRDTSPAPLNGLDRLLEMSQDSIQQAARRVEDCQAGLAAAANRLACATCLLHLMLRFKFALDGRSAELVTHALPAAVVDSLEAGWEERADAGLVHLLQAVAAAGGVGGAGDRGSAGAGAAAGPAAAADAAAAAMSGLSALPSGGVGGASAFAVTRAGGAAAALAMPEDAVRLRQHLAALLDVLAKAGGRSSTLLSEALPAAAAGAASASVPSSAAAGRR
jgi:Bardet-Biedl syndrome 9 protein